MTRLFNLSIKKEGFDPLCMVGEKGIEPPRIAAQDPKSSASTNFATRPKTTLGLLRARNLQQACSHTAFASLPRLAKSAIQFSIHQAKLVF